MFKVARGTRAFGRWCVRAHLSRMAKREVRNIFHFCVFIPTAVFKIQEDCPIILLSKTILTNLKCREEIF